MTSNEDTSDTTASDDVQVDQQDGGPGSHSEDGTGGAKDDVASGGDGGDGDGQDDEIKATEVHDGAGDVFDDADAVGG